MLTNITLVPYVLMLYANVPNDFDETKFEPEYIYTLNKTIEVFREPFQVTYITGNVICHFSPPDTLHCLLHKIRSVTYLTPLRETLKKESDMQFDTRDWFYIKFNNYGVESITVNKNTDRKDIIIEIASVFNLGYTDEPFNNVHFQDVKISYNSFDMNEKTVVGTCSTSYNLTLEHLSDRKDDYKYLIRFSKDFPKIVHARLHIQKNRTNCQYSQVFGEFLNGLHMEKYEHTMDVIDDTFNATTIMEGRVLPGLGVERTRVFRKTMMLNLTTILKQTTEHPDPTKNFVPNVISYV